MPGLSETEGRTLLCKQKRRENSHSQSTTTPMWGLYPFILYCVHAEISHNIHSHSHHWRTHTPSSQTGQRHCPSDVRHGQSSPQVLELWFHWCTSFSSALAAVKGGASSVWCFSLCLSEYDARWQDTDNLILLHWCDLDPASYLTPANQSGNSHWIKHEIVLA